jgi:3-oxoacyl-[acyl-carrier-protein] synthase III
MTLRAKIVGTGSYAPPTALSNDDMKRFVDTSDEWITTRSGIKSRRVVENFDKPVPRTMATSDMCEHAASAALTQAGLSVDDIDLIIVGTVTPDMRVPSAAIMLQHKLKAKNAAAFDVNGACAGSLYALSIAEKFIASGSHKRALVVGAETLSSITNWGDRNTCVLFGDAAGACIVEGVRDDGDASPGFLSIDIYSDTDSWSLIQCPAGGSRTPLTAERLLAQEDKILMQGKEVYKFAVRALVSATENILKKHNKTTADIKAVCAHQANLRIIESVAERLHVPLSSFVLNIQNYGNTSAASALVTLDEGRRDGRIASGDLVLMLAIGAGMCWAAGLYRA